MQLQVGNVIYHVPQYGGLDRALSQLIALEEERVLALRQNGVNADEDILIHLVRMYMLRWAVPAIEIETGGRLELGDLNQIQRRFWLCMFGRAVDDLCDRDSWFFAPADSILLAATYGTLLNLDPTVAAGADILRRTAESMQPPPPNDNPPEALSFALIRDDVCRRVAYFLSPSGIKPGAVELLRRYVGVLLGRCDLDDCLVDGRDGAASTVISRSLHGAVADPEGKIHLDNKLFEWYSNSIELLRQEAERLTVDLTRAGAVYASGIVASVWNQQRDGQDAMALLSQQLEQRDVSHKADSYTD
jgi:hypothetical protein